MLADDVTPSFPIIESSEGFRVISAHNHFGPWPFRSITISAHIFLYIDRDFWFSVCFIKVSSQVLFEIGSILFHG